MKRPPLVAVHSLLQARTVLATRRDAALISGRGAGWYAGAAWWVALIDAAGGDGTAAVSNILDCADAPGAAVAALQLGQRLLVLDPDRPAFPRVTAMARELGAVVLPIRPDCLDLAEPGSARRLAAWLGGDDDTMAGLR